MKEVAIILSVCLVLGLCCSVIDFILNYKKYKQDGYKFRR